MDMSIQDLAQMHRDFYLVNPRDLVDDLADEDPHLEQASIRLDLQLAEMRDELEKKEESEEDYYLEPEPPKKPEFAKDTLVKAGWNDMQIKGKKNWADFENLMYLYALDKLFSAETMPAKAKQDKVELTYVVEEFDRLKHPQLRKHLTAEQRLKKMTTYVAYGKRTIDASCQKDLSKRACDLHDLEREYMDAEGSNEFNGMKLRKAYHIARRVMGTLRNRY